MNTETYVRALRAARAMIAGIALSGCSAGAVAPELAPTLEDIQLHVFDQACSPSGCHDATTAAGALDLSDADASFASLVSMPADNAVAAENGWLRVSPERPELSFLIRKLTLPGVGEGAPMPVGAFELTDYYLGLIDAWIADGASR